jgi:histidyl-tRNA synthetase
MRQFWQIGAEALNMTEPSADAEMIALLWRLFEGVGIPAANMRLLLNSMGDEKCRPAYRQKVASFILANSDGLCEECNRRATTNPLRAFDCKVPGCQEIMAGAPLLRDELCDECRDHYASVGRALVGLGIPFEEEPRLVRGLDYYTRTVFEVQVEAGLGSQNAIGGGGRYDRLMEEYGGASTPSLGFALGFERTLLAMQAAGAIVPAPSRAQVYVARVDKSVAQDAFLLASALRDAGVATECDHQARSLKSQFKQADKLGAHLVAIVGPDELTAGQITVRDMGTKEERRVAMIDAPAVLRSALD